MGKYDKFDVSDISNAINKLASAEPSSVKEWVIEIDRLLTDRGCKMKSITYNCGGVAYDYVS